MALYLLKVNFILYGIFTCPKKAIQGLYHLLKLKGWSTLPADYSVDEFRRISPHIRIPVNVNLTIEIISTELQTTILYLDALDLLAHSNILSFPTSNQDLIYIIPDKHTVNIYPDEDAAKSDQIKDWQLSQFIEPLDLSQESQRRIFFDLIQQKPYVKDLYIYAYRLDSLPTINSLYEGGAYTNSRYRVYLNSAQLHVQEPLINK